MIGVFCKPEEIPVAKEFFQLFKTPWELYVANRKYAAVVDTTGEAPASAAANLHVIYSSRQVAGETFGTGSHAQMPAVCEWDGTEFPIYHDALVFKNAEHPLVTVRGGRGSAVWSSADRGPKVVRVGYDIFQEVAFLLSEGQPEAYAHIPTLEIHIALLRQCLWDSGTPFVEIPPVPAGYKFAACLTHDVDFVGIRLHKGDHTMWGFLYRALVGSLVGAVRGRVPWSRVVRNWKAALSLPLVHLGIARDFWLEFDRYREIERGLGSTFYFIPYRGQSGRTRTGCAPDHRAAPYDVGDLKNELTELASGGCEVGLHGIDAWHDAQSAATEARRIEEVSGLPVTGVRMHWLYFDQDSPEALGNARLCYDSTFGYNGAVGFRAGTSQVFSLRQAAALLELPLILQDTALFYPDRMDLSEAQAGRACDAILEQLGRHGGALTVNWHTRSLSPERLWGDFYQRLVDEMKSRGAFFSTARQCVAWFERRRSLHLENVEFTDDGVSLRVTCANNIPHPGYVIRVYHPQRCSQPATSPKPLDMEWGGEEHVTVGMGSAVSMRTS